jgi:hypothetical protein
MQHRLQARRRGPALMVGFGLCHLLGTAVWSAPEALPTGQVVDSIACLHDSEQRYAFYLPSSYHPGRPWPILYAFHAGARGQVPVELFREPAERFGYIVVGSNNSRNGPQAPVVAAVEALWRDTHARFAIDPKRIYATGMSGGTFPAALVAAAYGAGIISCGGAARPDLTKNEAPAFAWLGIAGDADFNYQPTRDVVRVFAGRSCTARFLSFEGGHSWPPKDVAARAIEWLEVVAMRDGLRPSDAAFVGGYLTSGVARAQSAVTAGRLGEACAEYAALARELRGLTDVAPLDSEARRLYETREAKLERKRDAKRTEEELAQSQRLFDLFAGLEQPDRLARHSPPQQPAPADDSVTSETRPPLNAEDVGAAVRRELRQEISRLKRDCDSEEQERRLRARRVLEGFQAGVSTRGRDSNTNGNHEAARIAFEVCLEIRPGNVILLYDLARTHAASRKAKAALAGLRRAVDAGFSDAKRLSEDPVWDFLRAEAEYLAIVSQMREKALESPHPALSTGGRPAWQGQSGVR